jgi:hypothetical protein
LKRYEQLRVLSLLTLAILLWSNTVAAQVTKAKTRIASEGFSFLIKDFSMDHQGEVNNLNLTIRYRYKAPIANSDYPDFTVVAGDIERLLANYPNKTDYWEIVNKRITLLVLEKYPAIAEVTSEIQVSPSAKVRYVRSSIMTRDRR